MFDNIFDNYIQDGLLDIGALEKDVNPPSYGHQFSDICERNDLLNRVWNGNISSAWYEPNNWSPCGVPVEVTNVIIPGELLNYPYINTNVIINNASITGDGKLEISNQSLFILNGN